MHKTIEATVDGLDMAIQVWLQELIATRGGVCVLRSVTLLKFVAAGRDRYADREWDDTVTVLCIAERTA